jgi:hypothetical protein
MVVLFPGAPLSVIAMSIAMESAKLVTAGWLARRWRVTAWIWRTVLVALVAGLAVINATGVYARLVQAHVGTRAVAISSVQAADAALAARIDAQQHTVADIDRRLAQIDGAIDEANGFRNEARHRMSKPRSYIRPDDGAMMIEVEPDQYVNAKVLQLQGRHPGALDEPAPATAKQSARRRVGRRRARRGGEPARPSKSA